MENKSKAELERQLEKARKEIEYYKRISKEAGDIRLRETEELSQFITERKQAEGQLKHSEERLKILFEYAPGGYYLNDLKGTFIDGNRVAERITGYKREELIGKSFLKLKLLFPKQILKAAAVLAKNMQGKPTGPDEFTLNRKDGTQVAVEITTFPVKIKGQTLVLGIARDISEHKLAEEALKESEEKYRTILDSIEEVYFEVDIDGNFTFFNDSLSKILGYSKDELAGMNNRDYMPPESSKKIYNLFNQIYKTGNPIKEVDYEIIRKDGSRGFHELSASLMRDEAGHPIGFRGIAHDVTEVKLAEEALKESEEKYRTILENIEDGYYEVDIAGNLTFFNDSLCKITGSSKDELMGMNNREYMDEENAKKVYQIFNKVYNTGKPTKGFEYEIILRKDGSKRHVESSLSLIKDSEGNRVGFRGIIRDITDRKHMEAELIQTKDFLQNIFNSSIDGITTTDLQGNVIYTSPRTRDILGYRKEKIIGKKVHSFYGNEKEDAKAIMKELMEKGELRDHEMKFIRKDGELVDINLSASLLKDEKGEVIGTLGIYRDITEKKHLEAQLAQAQRVEAIGTLAGGIAHNFNNLLMAIQGNTSLMLLNKTSSDPDYERLRNIEKSVQSGSRLTRQLLGYAREGRYEIRPSSLNQLVEETSNTFGTTKKEITLHRELAKDLWGIKADQGQIEQVLLNLYVNAADAMPGGGDLFLKTMNVTHKDMKNKLYKAKPGNYVLLTVRDTGTGMDKKTMKRIFDPFFTTKGLAKGTGLGLASVYGIVKAHGGYIDVDSKKGHGTTFSIYLPGSERKVEKPVKSAKRITEGTGIILLVDDEEMVLDVGVQLLKTLGYTVLEAKGGKEAVEIYKANKDKIDMVILDMIMPGVGGGEAYDRMKEINPTIKVLLSSGYSIDGQATEILERGCDGFIQKPFNMKQLSRSIREILDKQ